MIKPMLNPSASDILSPFFRVRRMAPIPRVRRTQVSRSALETAIAAAIKAFDASCQNFIGVIIETRSTESDLEANWQVKGLRFGKSDRDKARAALNSVLPPMQQQFILQESHPRF
jgi:hypothetical protein